MEDERSGSVGWLVATTVVVAAALRLFEIVRVPFEQDELYSVIEARELFDSPLLPGIEARPLYYLLQHPILEVAPVTHVSMRLLPLLFGLAGVALTVWVAARVFGRSAAVVTALLVTFSGWHLHISGMARYWSLVYLLAVSGFWLLLRARRHDRVPAYLGVFVVLALGIASHLTLAFPFVGALVALHFGREGGRWTVRLPSRPELLGLWAPMLVFVLAAYAALSATGNESAVRNFEGRGLIANLRLLPAIAQWLTPAVLTMGGLGALLGWLGGRTDDARRWGWMSLAGMASTLVLLAAAAQVTDVYADYAAAMLPLVFVSAGGLVQLAVERLERNRNVALAAVGLVVLAGMAPSTVSHLSDGNRFDFRPAFARFERESEPGALLLSTPIIFQRHYAPDLRGAEFRMDPAALDTVLAAEGRFWAALPVRRYGIVEDWSGAVAEWLDDHCSLVETFERPRFDYRVYRVALYRCGADAGGLN
ncbi:MAG: glycosyltransferase family 39 protein [Gemmatimonadota bacterium]